MFSLRWLGLFVVLSGSLALSACGGGEETDPSDPVLNEQTSEIGEPETDPVDPDDGAGSGEDLISDDSSNSDSITDDVDGTDTTDTTDSGSVNNAPEISGTPTTEVTENAAYGFTPTASDPDGDDLSFTIENRPAWGHFDVETGTLSGTPAYTDVGTTTGIVISVTDGTLTTALAAFNLTVIDDGIGNGTAAISWTPPTTRTDGSALTDLAGYRIHYGQKSGDYSSTVEIGAGITSHIIEQLDEGQWYFAMTALDGQGLESDFSGEGEKLVAY